MKNFNIVIKNLSRYRTIQCGICGIFLYKFNETKKEISYEVNRFFREIYIYSRGGRR